MAQNKINKSIISYFSTTRRLLSVDTNLRKGFQQILNSSGSYSLKVLTKNIYAMMLILALKTIDYFWKMFKGFQIHRGIYSNLNLWNIPDIRNITNITSCS